MAAENTSVEIRDDREHGKLVAHEDGAPAGSIAYFVMYPEPGALVAVHTVVGPEYQGRGIAGALAREFYALASSEGSPPCRSVRTSRNGPSATRSRRPRPRKSWWKGRGGSSGRIPVCSDQPVRRPGRMDSAGAGSRTERRWSQIHAYVPSLLEDEMTHPYPDPVPPAPTPPPVPGPPTPVPSPPPVPGPVPPGPAPDPIPQPPGPNPDPVPEPEPEPSPAGRAP